MSDLICLDCRHYNMITERCTEFDCYIPSTDESGSMASCSHRQKFLQHPQEMVLWHNNDTSKKFKYTLCRTCNVWYNIECDHMCENVRKDIERTIFLSESEMQL